MEVPKFEREPSIKIYRSSEAPEDVRANPFFDPEIWGRASSPEEIYLPDKDEGVSFAIAAHEIGHLVAKGKIENTGIDNFEATLAEEIRAWEKGWDYLAKHLDGFEPEKIQAIKSAFDKIKKLLIEATEKSRDLYFMKGSVEERRKRFFDEEGEELKKIFEEVKNSGTGQTPDWEELINIVTKAVKDILRDNAADKNSINK